jgi:hypothetical protein
MTLPNKPGMGFLGVFGYSVAEELDALAEGGEAEGRHAEMESTSGGFWRRGRAGGMRGARMLANGLAAPGRLRAGWCCSDGESAAKDANGYFADKQTYARASAAGQIAPISPLMPAAGRSWKRPSAVSLPTPPSGWRL